VNKKEES